MEYSVFVSDGNSKLGKIPNASLPPVLSCKPGVPCATQGCYSMKAFRRHDTVWVRRMRNWAVWQQTPTKYFAGVVGYLKQHDPAYFRWHSDGDIPNQDYYKGMIQIAKEFPGTRFLAFTKQYEINPKTPENLTLLMSIWPRYPFPKSLPARNRLAWMEDKTGLDPRLERAHHLCHGACDDCFMCWHINDAGVDVLFQKH
jgi:hypothetical protein